MRQRIHKHLRPKCQPISAKEMRGYERLLAAVMNPPDESPVEVWCDDRPTKEQLERAVNLLIRHQGNALERLVDPDRPVFPGETTFEEAIAPTSCIWGMVEQDPRLWN